MCGVPDQARSPAEFRRAAELWEFLGEPAAARRWWHQAAHRGDQDAIDYLALMDEEAASPGSHEGALSCVYVPFPSPQRKATAPAAVDEYAALYKLLTPMERRRQGAQRSKEEILIREIEDFLQAHQSTTEAGWPN
jgi:hypothetical protein